MDFSSIFGGFWQPVAYGSIAVVALLIVIRLRTPRRSPALIGRRPRQ
jgi:hypothetical protein